MDVISQLRAPAVLAQRKNPGYALNERMWAPELIRTFWKKSKISCPCSGISKLDLPARRSGKRYELPLKS
jgi:hypothetical protein